MEIKKEYMRRAIELAQKARGWTNPNPLVGAVIVKNDRIIGEGYHERYGELHAERNAFKNLTESAEGATLYVTLEPCCHTGKQPPCTEAIIENKINRVVIGSRDPNALVSGKGVKQLREAGVEVVEDFMKEECDKLNPIFFYYIKEKKPYIALKFAMTLDGKIATSNGDSQWITGEKAREHVHNLRNDYKAILVGIGTVLADDSMLNSRIKNASQPVRIVVDSNLRIPLDSQIVKTANSLTTIVATLPNNDQNKKKKLESHGIIILELGSDTTGKVSLEELITKLGEIGIDSVLVEGGGEINESFLQTDTVNHVYAYIAPKLIGGMEAKTPIEGNGIKALSNAKLLELENVLKLGDDLLLEYNVNSGS